MPFFTDLFGESWIHTSGTSNNAVATVYVSSNGGSTPSSNTTFININYISTSTTNATFTSTFINEFVIDEDDYMNHAEYYELARQRGIVFRIRTAEEKRLAQEAAERQRVEAEQRALARLRARAKARELLLSHLTAEQKDTFEKNGWFIVIGGKSKKQYRIRTNMGVAGNIQMLTRHGGIEAILCCHCRHDIPEYDQFLAQKIALTWDEDFFLKTANKRAA